MKANSMELSFDMRTILQELSKLYKGCVLGLYAESHRKNQISWYRFLGFTYKPERNIGNNQYFEYMFHSI